jgi:hypothetical protein
MNIFRNENHISYQNYWAFGLSPSSGILGNRKHDVSETSNFPKRRVF